MPLLRTRHDQRTGFSPNVPREQVGLLPWSITLQPPAKVKLPPQFEVEPIAVLVVERNIFNARSREFKLVLTLSTTLILTLYN